MTWRAKTIFYHQLAMVTRTGIQASEAVKLVADNSPPPYRQWAPTLQAGLSRGGNLAEGLAACGEKPLVCALIEAGEQSGRLAGVCKEIVDFYQLAIDMRRMVIGRMLYPVLLLNFAMVVFPFTQVMLSGLSPWWILWTPLCFWGTVGTAIIASFILRGSGLMAHIALLPGLRFLTMPLVVHNSLMIINACLESGMMMAKTWRLTAGACGNAVMGVRLRATAEDFERDPTPTLTEALESLRYPGTIVAIIRAGEIGGNLDTALVQASDFARESFHARITWTTRILLGTIYFLILLTVAAAILTAFYQIWFKPINEAMNL